MPVPVNITEARLGINMPLTNLAQGYKQQNYVMKLLYPMAEVSMYGGQVVSFDDSDYEDVSDDRADGTPYPEIQDGYEGKPFKLNYKGLSYKVPDKKRNEMSAMRINWGALATGKLMNKAGLRHEIESATVATNLNNYQSSNRLILAPGSQFNESGVDPDPVIRRAKTTVGDQIGVDPNVMILGQSPFDAMASKYANNFTSTGTTPGLRQQLTEDTLAAIFGFARVRICKAIRKVGNTRQRIFGKNIIMAYTNPAALDADKMPYRPTGPIDINMLEPSFGYTYVYQGNPLMYDPGRNEEAGYTFYKMDFDRKVVNTGVNEATNLIQSGFIIANAVA